MPDYELILQKLYTRHLRPGDFALDVGANVGSHTLSIARCVGPEGKVMAFEPLESCRNELTRQVTLAGPEVARAVEIFPFALGEDEGEAEYVFAIDAPWLSGLRERTYDVPTRKQVINVPLKKLDSMAVQLPKLAYIKIDCEGGELGVLRGAEETIRKFRPLVSFEFGANSIWAYQITPADMAEFWGRQNCLLFDILGRKLGKEEFVASAIRQEVWDYLAIPQEREQIPTALFVAENG